MSSSTDRRAVQSSINVTPLIDVLLVLLIIFLVVMPLMMKKEALAIPRTLADDQQLEPETQQLTLAIAADGSVIFSDGVGDGSGTPLPPADIARTLRARLEHIRSGQAKVVFVDFDDHVGWGTVVATMDTIRGLAADVDHDEITVALKLRSK